MEIQVYRTNSSSYQNHHFFQKEKATLEEIQGVRYISSLKEISKDLPFVLLTNTHTIPEELPAPMLDNTMLIVHPNSGYDNFDTNFVQKASYPIIIGNPIRAHAVVEYCLSCIFHHFTSIPNHLHWSSSRTWSRKLLRDQKVLILGHGHIGKILNQSMSPLCKEVVIYDPYFSSNTASSNVDNNVRTSWDDQLLDDVEILIVASSLTEKNKQFLDHKKLKRLHSECIIINAARGELINEHELIQFLKKNPNVKCYLDVFNQEPFAPGHLHEIKNLNKTSHIAGVYATLNDDIIDFEHQVIKDFIYLHNKHSEHPNQRFEMTYSNCLLKNRIVDQYMI